MSWPTEKLALAATRIGGGTPSRKNPSYWGGNIPWFTVADLEDRNDIQKLSQSREGITQQGLDNSAAKLIPSGAIVFSTRVVVGKVGIAQNELVTNQDFSSFIPSNEFDTEYLAYFLIKSKSDLRTIQRGATIKGVTTKVLDNLVVPKPPKDEQRRIVAHIKECMERVEEIEGNGMVVAEELKALFPAMLHEKFTTLSEEVPVDCLENVAEIKGGGSLPKGVTQDTGNNCVLLVKVGDMNEPGNERIIKVSRGYIAAEKAGKKVAQPGSVIFPKRGGAIATNKKRILGRPALIDPNLMAVVAHPEKLRPEYLYYWTQTIDLAQISNGGVIPQLNRKDLAPLEIPVPDLDLQDKIISELEQIEASCFELQVNFNSASLERSALRESILRKAFAGEL